MKRQKGSSKPKRADPNANRSALAEMIGLEIKLMLDWTGICRGLLAHSCAPVYQMGIGVVPGKDEQWQQLRAELLVAFASLGFAATITGSAEDSRCCFRQESLVEAPSAAKLVSAMMDLRRVFVQVVDPKLAVPIAHKYNAFHKGLVEMRNAGELERFHGTGV